MKAIFEPIPEDWERKPYFDYYYYTIKTKYNLNHHIDITELVNETQKRNLKFYPTFLYVIMRGINQNEEFRISFNEKGDLGIWNFVMPSYTIFHEDTKTFSDVWSEYKPHFKDFYSEIIRDMKTYKDVKQVKARDNRPPNFCPISVLPWLSFHSFSQDTYSETSFLYPIIRFGKYYQKESRILIPFSVFVSHAVADGYHTCKLINEIEELGRTVDEWIE
jgi:chloramphenicol O-acetyltransferase type A